MKLIISALTIIVAQIAIAGGLTYEWPSVNGLAINNACATATTFKSLTPVKYCSETKVIRYACQGNEMEYCRVLKAGEKLWPSEYLKEEVSCIAYASMHKEVSRTVTTQECVKYEGAGELYDGTCAQWETKTTFVGTTFNVSTYQDHGNEIGNIFAGSVKFTVPNCK